MLIELDKLADEADLEDDTSGTSTQAHIVSFNNTNACAPTRAQRVFPFQVDELWRLEDPERAAKIKMAKNDPTDFINAFKSYHRITDDDNDD